MKITISTQENNKRIEMGSFENPKYASQFVEAVLNEAITKREYIKLTVDCAEEDK